MYFLFSNLSAKAMKPKDKRVYCKDRIVTALTAARDFFDTHFDPHDSIEITIVRGGKKIATTSYVCPGAPQQTVA